MDRSASDARRQHLRGLLDAYRTEDPREQEFVRRFHALLQNPGDPFARDHFQPGHVTASAFVLSPERDEVLLILHGKAGLWFQPGGHVDPDDVDVLAAARREVREEVGVEAEVLPGLLDVDIHDIPPHKGDPAHAHYDVRFLMVAPSRDFLAGSDAKAARWVALDAVSEVASDASVMRAVARIRARL